LAGLVVVACGFNRGHYGATRYSGRSKTYQARALYVPNKAWQPFTGPSLAWASVSISSTEDAVITYAATTDTDAAGVEFRLYCAGVGKTYTSGVSVAGTSHTIADTIPAADSESLDGTAQFVWSWRYNDGAGHVGDWVELEDTGPAGVVIPPFTGGPVFEREQWPAPAFAAAATGCYVSRTFNTLGLTTVPLAAVATVTVRLWNITDGVAVSTDQTKGPAATVGVAAEGTGFLARAASVGSDYAWQYKAVTTVAGYKNVTAWTEFPPLTFVSENSTACGYDPDAPTE
jgi:hypothetical protein